MGWEAADRIAAAARDPESETASRGSMAGSFAAAAANDLQDDDDWDDA